MRYNRGTESLEAINVRKGTRGIGCVIFERQKESVSKKFKREKKKEVQRNNHHLNRMLLFQKFECG